MFDTILLAAALQQWERYSTYALAARDVAGALARQAKQLHVLSVYEYEQLRIPTPSLAVEMAAKLREQEIERTDTLVRQRLDAYVAPLVAQGLPVATILRLGSARHVIVEVATEIEADLVVIGSHSKRGLIDIPIGGTARHVSTHASCAVLMVAPKK